MEPPSLKTFALPGVWTLIAFLSYSSQFLLGSLEPQPLTTQEVVIFNVLVSCIWICYYRACFTDPGLPDGLSDGEDKRLSTTDASANTTIGRWCKKCEAPKPPRAHHCKECKKLLSLIPTSLEYAPANVSTSQMYP